MATSESDAPEELEKRWRIKNKKYCDDLISTPPTLIKETTQGAMQNLAIHDHEGQEDNEDPSVAQEWPTYAHAMDAILGKRYKLDTSENFEDYLKFLEVGFFHRKTGLSTHPISSLVRNPDGTYTFTMYTTLRSTITTFRVGEEFVEDRADGVKVRSLMEIEGNKLIQTQVEQNGRKSTHIREFTPETLTVTTTAEGWDGKAVRVYRVVD